MRWLSACEDNQRLRVPVPNEQGTNENHSLFHSLWSAQQPK